MSIITPWHQKNVISKKRKICHNVNEYFIMSKCMSYCQQVCHDVKTCGTNHVITSSSTSWRQTVYRGIIRCANNYVMKSKGTSRNMPMRHKVWKVRDDFKKSHYVQRYVKYTLTLKSTSWSEKKRQHVTKFVAASKSTSKLQKVHIKVFIKSISTSKLSNVRHDIKNTSWRKNYGITSQNYQNMQ